MLRRIIFPAGRFEIDMTSLTVSLIVFGCVFGAALLGMLMRSRLPEHHLSPDSKDVVKLGMGLVGTMTALVLGLLIASAKSSFDAQRTGVSQLAANVIMLDRTLARYGPEAKDARDYLRASVADLINRTWPEEGAPADRPETKGLGAGQYELLYEKIQDLTPKSDTQRAMQDQALKTAMGAAQTRWQMFAEKGSSIPTPFLVVMIFWLALILMSFGLFAPRNATAMLALMLCALTIASAIFLVLELDRPFEGMIRIPSTPLRSALGQLGR
jgi:hypothetical protein